MRSERSPEPISDLAGRGGLRLLLAQLLVVDARGEHAERLLAVLVLRARVLAFHHDAGGQVRDADRRVGLVDVLAAGAGGAEGVDAQLGRIEHHLVDRVGLGQHRHRAGRGVDAALRLGLGHALHAMAAGLELELRVRALPDDARDHFLVAAELGGALRNDLHLPALALGVARVHAEQVAGEKRRFVAAGAGAHLEEGVALVVRVLAAAAPSAARLPAAPSRRAPSSAPRRRRTSSPASAAMSRASPASRSACRYSWNRATTGRQLGVLARQAAELVQVARGVLGREQLVQFLQAPDQSCRAWCAARVSLRA